MVETDELMNSFRPTIFRSFWMGGFESACHVNRAGIRLDMLHATQHDRFVSEDYSMLVGNGIGTVRDTIRWHRVETTPGAYDFSSVDPYMDAANRVGVEVIWDLLHYGLPEGLDIYSGEFVERFAAFSHATAQHVAARVPGQRFYTPINELSFFAWAAGEVGWFHPFSTRRGGDVKRQLVRAWIAAVNAIRAVDPAARIVSIEPVIHTVPPKGKPDIGGRAAAQNDSQWEAWDMIIGRTEPELGGHDRYLDIMGVNFYHDNQWEVPGGEKIHWHIKPRDRRWVPFSQLIRGAYDRYKRPILIGETSHVGSGRAEWIRELTDEVIVAVKAGLPLEGICLYPIMDRFEWNDPTHWHNSGLWDYVLEPDGTFRRVLNEEYGAEFHRSRLRLAAIGFGSVEPNEATA
jgi:beta-glucosidase/6-phospho-beta-glucosidase/beta-galactosidase